jgi:hypothetical protein
MHPAAILVVLVLLSAAFPAQAKPKRCLSPAEVVAEQEIRHGIYLREATGRCDSRLLPGAKARWQKFETANGQRFRNANQKRVRAWQREYPDDWQAQMNYADGRLVSYDRNIPLTAGFCENIDELMTTVEKRGYNGFSKQAKVVRNQVVADYKVCQ